ncbi:unnamed protein product [Phyllotreta striolata]|uniref:SCA7 domain-containing protein n=1 Tax=Phyllotreta striolata TaxID=444603 RepID=A0A9N9TJV8_PHYSR|nr:unnamed protein product [Phyllotreta striolata]
MEDYFESFPIEIKKWDILRAMHMTDLNFDVRKRKDHGNKKTIPNVQLLPRQNVTLYGTMPKMEQRIFTKCKECRLVFNPRNIMTHKVCPERFHSSTSDSSQKDSKTKGNSSRKSHSYLPPLFKVSKTKSPSPSVSIPDLSQCKVSPKMSKSLPLSSPSTLTNSNKSETRLSPSSNFSKVNSHSPRSSLKTSLKSAQSDSNCSSTSSTSSRHKKSRKSSSSNNAKVTEEFDPNVHCGVVEGNSGPCTRSITCNNHRVQSRKSASSQLITKRTPGKEKEPMHGSNCSYTTPNGQPDEAKDSFSQNTTYAPVAGVLSSANELLETNHSQPPVLTKISEPKQTFIRQTTSVVVAKQPILTDTENGNTKTLNNNYIMNKHSKDSDIGSVPLVYMPMGLISFVHIGKSVICLESQKNQLQNPPVTNQSLYLALPNQHSNIKMYKSHPKPVAVPNYGTKKVRGALLLSNRRLKCQRDDILKAITPKRRLINNTQLTRDLFTSKYPTQNDGY